MVMSRRQFLIRGTAFLATVGIGGALLWTEKQLGLSEGKSDSADHSTTEPVLVVVQLSGGNDGINTVIPYGSGAYYDARATLRVEQKEVLPLNDAIGLHPSLQGLHQLYQQGELAVVNGVGYPNPNRSHFRSMEIWQTAVPEQISDSGWLGRYASAELSRDSNPLKAVQVGDFSSKAFRAKSVNIPVIHTLDTFQLFGKQLPPQPKKRLEQAFQQMYNAEKQTKQVQVACQRGMDAYDSMTALHQLSAGYIHQVKYPNTRLAGNLQLVSELLAGKSKTKVFYTYLGGFDDHADEKTQHTRVLKELDEALTAFQQDLAVQGLDRQVVTLVFSEFGRRVAENSSGGTDHGTAAPVLILGKPVKGGLYGEYPSLTNLDQGDLKYQVDFRSIYATLLEHWMQADAHGVLGSTYETLHFV